jgi:hypothetical protein
MDTPVTEPLAPAGPPAWDPLGAAPFAWDLPEPTPVKVEQESPAPRQRSRVGGITLGAALAVGGGCALLAPYTSWLSPGHIVGIVLAVIGLGMVGGSLVRGGRGLIGLAVPLALAGFVLTADPSTFDGATGDWGTISDQPTSAANVLGSYSNSGGSIDLDLRSIPDTDQPVQTSASVGIGHVSILVPPTADVTFTCDANLGSVDCLGLKENSTDAHVSSVDNGTDGPGGLKIYLDARANSGTVEVRRG